MTYIDRLNEFHQWCESNDLPVNAKLLYFNFLNAFNKEKWPRNLRVDTTRLMLLSGCQKSAAFRMRDKLVEAGFIGYKKGRKGTASVYFLSSKETKSETISETTSETISETTNETLSNRYKTKEKEYPPISPQGESESFLRFWEAYPRKINRGKAEGAWESLCPDDVLAGIIMSAVAEQKQSAQWQEAGGKYIPSPAKWLEECRWKEKLTPAAKQPCSSYDMAEIEKLSGLRLPDKM